MPSGPLRGRPDRPAKGTTAKARTPHPNGFLLGATQNNLRRHAGRARGDVGQLIPGECERPSLLSAVPVRKGAALDTKDKEPACLVHPVSAEMGDAPLGDGPALLGRLRDPVVGEDLRQVTAQTEQRAIDPPPASKVGPSTRTWADRSLFLDGKNSARVCPFQAGFRWSPQ